MAPALRRSCHRQRRRPPPRGDFVSPTTSEVLRRLRDTVGVTLPNRHRKRLDALRRRRNRIEHFALIDTEEAIRASTAGCLIVIDFISDEIGVATLSPTERELYEQVREALPRLGAYVSARRQDVASTLAQAHAEATVVTCPSCEEEALVLEGAATCLFCRYRADAIEAADDFTAKCWDSSSTSRSPKAASGRATPVRVRRRRAGRHGRRRRPAPHLLLVRHAGCSPRRSSPAQLSQPRSPAQPRLRSSSSPPLRHGLSRWPRGLGGYGSGPRSGGRSLTRPIATSCSRRRSHRCRRGVHPAASLPLPRMSMSGRGTRASAS